MNRVLLSLLFLCCVGCGGTGEVERPENPAPMPDPGSLSTAGGEAEGGEDASTLNVD